jgi:hypothetical protein
MSYMRIPRTLYYSLCIVLIVCITPQIGLVRADSTNTTNAYNTATLFLEAYNLNGTPVTISEFISYTFYAADSSKRWMISENYGVFPIGTPPAVAQIGSKPFVTNKDSHEYITLAIPVNQPLYFTCLWKAPTIGTVFLRADNQGSGYVVPDNQSLVLQLPYEFALSEYHKTKQILTDYSALGYPFSAGTSNALALANTQIESAKSATSSEIRAVASYEALATVMPLKERLVREICDHLISQNRNRTDFILNYLGLGSWLDSRFVPYYGLVKEARFTFVHTNIDWKRISTAQGSYDFSSLDYEINQALSLGFSVALNIMQSVENLPEWALQLPFDDLKNLYFENARLVVKRYKDKAAMIYAIAEPELVTHNYNIEQIAELISQSLAGARDAAPSRLFGIFLSASAYVGYQMNRQPGANFLSSWDLINYIAKNNIQADFYGLQMQYATIFAPVDLQRIYEYLTDVYNVLKKPIYICETTYSSKTEDYGIQSEFGWHDGLTQRAQAEWADGILRMSFGNMFIKGISWTHLDPDNYDYGSDFLSSLIGSSLIRSDGTPKAAYYTFKNFVDIKTISPRQGTIGTKLRIEGASFGTEPGTVLLGNKTLKILKWRDNSINCRITNVSRSRAYNVTVRPKNASAIVFKNAFTVKRPEILSVEPRAGLTGDEITIAGSLFGTMRGKVTLGGENCRILYWIMDPKTSASKVKFLVPKDLRSGIYKLTLTNAVSSDSVKFKVPKKRNTELNNNGA